MNPPPSKSSSSRKPGSGRPKGATSFKEISLRDLNQIFKDEDLIVVSRVWLEKKGLRKAIKTCNLLNRQELPPS